MSTDVMQELKRRREVRRAEAARVHWNGVQRIAAGKDVKDVAALEAAMRDLGHDDEAMARHVEQVRELAKVAGAEAERDRLVREAQAAWAECNQFEQERTELLAKIEQRMTALRERIGQINGLQEQANNQMKRAVVLRTELVAAGAPEDVGLEVR